MREGMWWSAMLLAACTGAPEPTSDEPVPVPVEAGDEAPSAEAGEAPAQQQGAGAKGAAVGYRLSAPHAGAHLMDVVATTTCPGSGELEWWMATWTPGSYVVRDYSGHVEDVRSENGRAEKTAKNRWRVQCDAGKKTELRYRLYGRTLSVRTNWIDEEKLILNGAATFIFPERVGGPLRVSLDGPWKDAATGLDPDGNLAWVAADVDELIDSPIMAGKLTRHRFTVRGVPHEIVHLGDVSAWDLERAHEDVVTLVKTQIDFWGEIPYERYVFLNAVVNTRGGLEHADSTLMMTFTDQMESDDQYVDWLGLVSHEFFHTWNVKRLRPDGLGPFDYEHEVYTTSLWVAEGLTSYYDDLLLVRAGLMSPEAWMDAMGENIGRVKERPGRHVRSLAESSWDAWIKFYRPDEQYKNSDVGYYRKGAMVGWVLDGMIRKATLNRRSLDDVLLEAWKRYPNGYSEAEFRGVVDDVAGRSLDDAMHAMIDEPGDVDLTPALDAFGMVLEPWEPREGGWLGIELDGADVRSVRRDGPAFNVLAVGDEIIAVEGRRMKGGAVAADLLKHSPGDKVELLVSREGLIRTIPFTLGEPVRERWGLMYEDVASPTEVAWRKSLFGMQ